MEITAFEAQASRDDGIFGDHLRRILVLIAPDESLSNAIREVLSGQCQASADVFYRLRSAGIISGDSARGARMRCQLYSDYLSRSLQ